MNFFSEDDLKDLLEEYDNTEKITFEDTPEMIAARQRYENYILKHQEDNNK